MCGIAGFWDERASESADALRARAKTMADALAHRGPDGEGVWVDETVGLGLGHRRLAVVERTAAGDQPMVSADGRWVLVYNGELYDDGSLRAAGDAAGVVWRGHCDTELLLETCARLGVEAALGQLRGVFAFALWDRQRRELHLVRDRLGLKPLVYGWLGRIVDLADEGDTMVDSSAGPLVFASEAKSIRAGFPAWTPAVCEEARADYFDCGYVPAPRSIYRGLWALRPGEWLTIAAGGRVQRRRYWDLSTFIDRARARPYESRKQARQELTRVIDDAVARRMRVDVPIGVLLSGGVDSTVVAAAMREHGEVRSFTLAFDEPEYDESDVAAKVASVLGLRHYRLRASMADLVGSVTSLPDVADEPLADPAVLATLALSRAVGEHTVVALGGDGGDEVFAGYRRHVHANRIAAGFEVLPTWSRRLAAQGLSRLRPAWIDRLGSQLPETMRPNLAGPTVGKLARVIGAPSLAAAYGRQLGPALHAQWTREPSFGERLGGQYEDAYSRLGDAAAWFQLLDTMSYLPDDGLTKIDRASMHVGVEIRAPLLDPTVVEAGWRIPCAWRIEDGRGKSLLREIAAQWVPEEIAGLGKRGLAVPIGEWLRGPLREWGRESTSAAALQGAGLDVAEEVAAMWREHQRGERDHADGLWTVATYVAWWRRWG